MNDLIQFSVGDGAKQMRYEVQLFPEGLRIRWNPTPGLAREMRWQEEMTGSHNAMYLYGYHVIMVALTFSGYRVEVEAEAEWGQCRVAIPEKFFTPEGGFMILELELQYVRIDCHGAADGGKKRLSAAVVPGYGHAVSIATPPRPRSVVRLVAENERVEYRPDLGLHQAIRLSCLFADNKDAYCGELHASLWRAYAFVRVFKEEVNKETGVVLYTSVAHQVLRVHSKEKREDSRVVLLPENGRYLIRANAMVIAFDNKAVAEEFEQAFPLWNPNGGFREGRDIQPNSVNFLLDDHVQKALPKADSWYWLAPYGFDGKQYVTVSQMTTYIYNTHLRDHDQVSAWVDLTVGRLQSPRY